ncbi:MAG: hypothetical protein ACKPB3_07730, partial [Bacteroidota bacterium]
MSVQSNVEVNIAKQKKNIAWALLFAIFSFASYASWKWYTTPEKFEAVSTLSIPGENTPADFWTNTGIVSAKTKATATISNESFIQKTFEKTPAPAITLTAFDYADTIPVLVQKSAGVFSPGMESVDTASNFS